MYVLTAFDASSTRGLLSVSAMWRPGLNLSSSETHPLDAYHSVGSDAGPMRGSDSGPRVGSDSPSLKEVPKKWTPGGLTVLGPKSYRPIKPDFTLPPEHSQVTTLPAIAYMAFAVRLNYP